MSKDTFNQWHIAGFQAYKSASEQAITGAKQAEAKFPDPKLKQQAAKVAATTARHSEILSQFLAEAGASMDGVHDEILDGINRGTDLMVKAAKDDEALNVALITGGKVALNYFVTAFRNHVDTATALGLSEQAATFQQMADEQQALYDQYVALANSSIYPHAAQA